LTGNHIHLQSIYQLFNWTNQLYWIAYFWEQDKTVNSHFIADYKGGYGIFFPVSERVVAFMFQQLFIPMMVLVMKVRWPVQETLLKDVFSGGTVL
jgi:hypothetical protein